MFKYSELLNFMMEYYHHYQQIKWRLIASSLGGMIGTRFAELHPERVDSLILLAPAFNTESRWRSILDIEEWERNGTREIYNYKLGSVKHVKFDIFKDLVNHPAFPIPNCVLNQEGKGIKLFIIHGEQDDVVKIGTTDLFLERLVELNFDLERNVKVFRVPDGHELVSEETLNLIEKLVLDNLLL
ncbi:predicted protein [Naegleria gruberi]|uniref:Predicted protein n=1 Tax=Naegleria gruberi TaxID=5762 RepID=D2VSF4_NAEGR|nr:uncharacterized protein NAEGRDRAFT_71921 [Naegleria gruberi]EFC40111.1 predicted protein [Naegleria gruberi]|eukprot:XP_002672855.1 predicted protein [Naegleria gruberi strain NEG-M]